MEQSPELKKLYWDGAFNKSCRYWYYLNKGIDIFNQFRYLFALFFGIYYTLHLKNPWWLIAMFVISIPILISLGYLAVHRMGKIFDYLNVHFSTHWSKYQFELMENQLSTLKGIQDELKKRTHKNS